MPRLTRYNLEQLRLEHAQWRMEKSAALREIRHLEQTKREFEQQMRVFRDVCTAAWDAVMRSGQAELEALKIALEQSDHAWEGYAGCARDPDPGARLAKRQESTLIQ